MSGRFKGYFMFENFDFEVLQDPQFKEDAVREEIILPLIKQLGYTLTGNSKIIRSKSLVHPYVQSVLSREKYQLFLTMFSTRITNHFGF